MSEINMNAKDAISAKLADCYVTIEGRRYLLMQAKDFEAKFEKTKKEINILGKQVLEINQLAGKVQEK